MSEVLKLSQLSFFHSGDILVSAHDIKRFNCKLIKVCSALFSTAFKIEMTVLSLKRYVTVLQAAIQVDSYFWKCFLVSYSFRCKKKMLDIADSSKLEAILLSLLRGLNYC